MNNIDVLIFNFIRNLSGKWWLFDWLGIFFAEYLGYFLILAAAFLLLKERNWKQRIYFFSLAILPVILSRGIITEAIRFFYERPRPFLFFDIQPLIDHASTGSFPSGHAAAFFALALAVFYLNRQWGRRFLALVLLMGLARIFVGVHWPLDILAGAIIGLLSAFLIKQILPKQIKSEN
jgi:undecaprenyl-diphosphatase